MTLEFWGFTRFARFATMRFGGERDPATGERLTERNERFEIEKVLEMPWVFWVVMVFSLFETSTVSFLCVLQRFEEQTPKMVPCRKDNADNLLSRLSFSRRMWLSLRS
jgi:hypothetical protein